MKNILVAGLLTASVTVMASDYATFVGAELVTAELTRDQGAAVGHDTGMGVRAGLIAKDHRVYINYGQGETPAGKDVSAMGLNLEAMTEPYKFTDWLSSRVFVGGHVGATEYEDTYDAAYGVQGGVLFGFTDQVSLEFGLRYSLSEAANVDHVESFYGALNFQF